MTTDSGYLLANAARQSSDRFAALSAVFNHVTFTHLDAIGIGPGWRCWEVGAGGPSVPDWMAQRAGPSGRVVATDIDTTWLQAASPGIDVRTHDVASEPPPDDDFDVVHARLVLVHLPRRAQALANMVRSLRPGGWLIVEDFDTALITDACLDATNDAQRRANRLRHGFVNLLAARGVDLAYGRKLPHILRGAGLAPVLADAWFPLTHPATRQLEAANIAQVAAGLIDAGLASRHEIDAHLAALAQGDTLDLITPPLITVRGQKPVAGSAGRKSV